MSTATNPFKIGSIYNFNTLAPSVLEAMMIHVKILGIIDYHLASKYLDVDLMQRTLYPLLPPGTPRDARDYVYVLFETEAKIVTVLAMEWIDVNSIEEITSVRIKVTIDKAALEDVPRIRDTLKLMGHHDISIETTYR